MPSAARKRPPVTAPAKLTRTERFLELERLAYKALGPKARVTGFRVGRRSLVRAAVNDGTNILIDMPGELTALRQMKGALEGIIRSASASDGGDD